jgi:hypothetical protein
MRRALFQTAANTMLLDCSLYQTFVITLGVSVQTLELKKVSPGMLYAFVVRQDSKGSHSLNWGMSARNGTGCDPRPNSTTVQTFIGMAGGYMQANLPGTWT